MSSHQPFLMAQWYFNLRKQPKSSLVHSARVLQDANDKNSFGPIALCELLQKFLAEHVLPVSSMLSLLTKKFRTFWVIFENFSSSDFLDPSQSGLKLVEESSLYSKITLPVIHCEAAVPFFICLIFHELRTMLMPQLAGQRMELYWIIK